MTLRVAVVHEIVTPYRSPIFSALCDCPEVEVTVVLSALSEVRRSWSVDVEKLPYRWVMTKSWRLVTGRVEKATWIIPWGIGKALSEIDPDVVVVNGYSGLPVILSMIWARRRGRGLVLWSESIRQRRSGALLSLKRALVRLAHSYVVPGRLAAEYLIALGAPTAAIYRAPNCIDLVRFAPAERAAASPRRLLLCGRLVPAKNWERAIEAVAIADASGEASVVVVGTGPHEDALRACAARAGVTADFVGHVEYADLPRVIQGCDAMIFPTLDDVWGFVLNEATASGLPVIASRIAGGTLELVRDGFNGWIVEPDHAGLVEAIVKLLRLSSSEWKRMSEASRIMAEGCSVARAVEGFLGAINAAHATAAESRSGRLASARWLGLHHPRSRWR